MQPIVEEWLRELISNSALAPFKIVEKQQTVFESKAFNSSKKSMRNSSRVKEDRTNVV